jgi:hypothetical protein
MMCKSGIVMHLEAASNRSCRTAVLAMRIETTKLLLRCVLPSIWEVKAVARYIDFDSDIAVSHVQVSDRFCACGAGKDDTSCSDAL